MAQTLIRNISLSDLLRLSYPVSGTASLQSTSSRPLKRVKLDKTLLSNPNPSRKTFTPISLPVLLIGTVNLFSEPSSQHTSSCLNHCLSFSDPSSTICCYIADFDPSIIGREIHVLAWNYLSIKEGHRQGVLEIIQWRFPSSDKAPPHDLFLSVNSAQHSGLKARSFAFGMVKSVSLTFTLPIENGKTGEMGDSVGFLTEILTCMCDICAKVQCLNEKSGLHSFTESKVVYFIKPTHNWRPVLAKLVGKVMYILGLKKRLVVVGNESYIILVSTIKTEVSMCGSIVSCLPTNHDCGGAYRGIVTGIYSRGMVIELDKKVWLLIHDTLLVPHLSLRIGAIVSVRDFHVVCANFAWTRVTIFGTCVKTTFHIDSFAVSDSKFVKTEEKSILGNFVESLNLSAKFWVLLMVSCFKRKFRTVLSDKELLGSNNSEGLVQTYTSRSLPPDIFQSHNSMFMKFCNHDQCTYKTTYDQTECKLVVPLSNFVGKCEELWISIQSEISECSDKCDGISYPGFIRRIIPSEDFGCILMGKIWTCSSSGRLQLVDATGNLDVVIPDLPSGFNVHTIYEVSDYKVILEGFRIEGDSSVYDFGEPLSCSAIFKRHTYRKRTHGLVLYVQFYLKNSVCLTSPSRVPSNPTCSANLGTNHLLVISHKFPSTNNFPINPSMSSCSSFFAEALFLPGKFKLSENGELIQLENTFQDAQVLKRVSRRDHKKASGKGPWLASCSLSSRNRGVSATSLSQFDGGSSNFTRILLEFKRENFSKYQLLRIGGHYLLNCSEHFRSTRVCKCLEKDGSSIVTENTLWSLCLSFSDDVRQREEPSGAPLDELVLLKSPCELHEITDLKSVSQGITKLLPPPNQVLSVSSCVQLMFHQSRIFYGSTDLENQRLAQGDLISVCGKIEAFHVNDCDSGSFVATEFPANSDQRGKNICIHLADDNEMVVIRGNLSKELYPLGMGTGANATFHRLLLTCSSNSKEKLLLTPATYIEIISVREVKTNREQSQQIFRVDSLIESLCNVPALGSFSDFHSMGSKVTRFHCRVLTLGILVLENSTNRSVPAYKIPLAGFVLDDGSALCNCWTDDEHASTLLSLHDICSSFFSSDFSSLERVPKRLLASGLRHSGDNNGNSKKMVGYFLMHMLKKHHKVTVKNHGISLDVSCQDFSFHSGTGEVFSILEERLLNYIILSSCHGPTFSVTGSLMDASPLKQFDTYISESTILKGCAQNILIREVAHIDPLKDALNMLRDIKIR